jgi:predicted enzyme related to lactoylglutathione lyase
MSDAILGRPMWYELLTTDVKAAEAFYTKVIGWSITPFRPEPDAYDMWTRSPEMPVGGVMKIPQGMNFPPHWEMYIGVPKLEDADARIQRLGGSALSEVIDIPNIGRMRTMKDPQGAVFAIYEPAKPPMPEAAPEVGDASWHELYTTDAEAAMKFYVEVFGWKPTSAMDMGPMGKYHMFGRERELGGMMNKPKEMAQVPPNWGIYFRVPNVHEAAERVKTHGGQVLNGPMEVPGGDEIVNCMDPQGAAFSLHHRKETRDEYERTKAVS